MYLLPLTWLQDSKIGTSAGEPSTINASSGRKERSPSGSTNIWPSDSGSTSSDESTSTDESSSDTGSGGSDLGDSSSVMSCESEGDT